VFKNRLIIVFAIAYTLVLFVALTLWRMPTERLIPYFGERMSKGRLLLKMERASYSFPLGFNLEKISYALFGGENPMVDRLDRLSFRLNPFGLIQASLPVSFQAYFTGGTAAIRGSASIPLVGKNANLEITVSNFELGEMSGIKSLSGRDLKGTAGGDLKLRGDPSDLSTLSGKGRFQVQKGSVDTRMDLAGLKAIPFEIVRIPFTIKDGQLELEKAEMEGPMLTGALTGRIKLNKVLGSSALELIARFRPGPLFNQDPLAAALLSGIKDGSKEIILKIGGSLQKPTVGMEK
jgi:type II secretion system protein N